MSTSTRREAAGGHTKRDHIDKSDEYLLEIVRAARYRGPLFTISRIREGSFTSFESANDLVNRTLEDNRAAVDLVASGKQDEEVFTKRFGYLTGKEAFRPDANSDPYIRNTYEVRVVIRHDPRLTRGYRVHTAFPINRDPAR